MTNPKNHLIRAENGWDFWRIAALRSAGFSTRLVQGLATPATARAVDALLVQDELVRSARSSAIAACSAALGETGAGGDVPERAKVLKKAIKSLRGGGMPSAAPGLLPEIDTLRDAVRTREAMAEGLAEIAAADHGRVSAELAALARMDRFRQAVAWQNPALLSRAFDQYLRDSGAKDFKARQREQLLASYAQRYAMKNESVGFFGPVGWARFVDQGPAARVSPGEAVSTPVVARLEWWALDELAIALTNLPGMRPWIAPRFSPLMRFDGSSLHGPFGVVDTTPLDVRVLASIGNGRTAREIASLLHADADETSVYQVLEALEAQHAVVWRFQMPILAVDGPRALREQLASVGDSELREAAHRSLDEVTAARAELERASSAEALARVLAGLEDVFVKNTGKQATRNAGQAYAGRTLVIPLATRDVSIEFGRSLLDEISRPLELLATSARWLSFEIGQLYAREGTALFRQLRESHGTETIDLAHFWAFLSAQFPRSSGASTPPGVQEIFAEYTRRWGEILGTANSGDAPMTVRSADIRQAVERAFTATAPGWPSARCHSPDVMIAASSPDAISRGDYSLVLGEIHYYCNSIEQGIFLLSSPDPAALRQAYSADHPAGRVFPQGFGSGVGCSLADNPRNVIIEHTEDLTGTPYGRRIPMSQLVVTEVDGEVCVTTRDGSGRWGMRTAIDALFFSLRAQGLEILPVSKHTPRLTVDRMVILRETWRFQGGDLEFAKLESSIDRFTAARAWAQRHGMPRYCFYKSSTEMKPCYVDFESMLFVDALAKAARNSEAVTVSEMLPDPDQAWLPDREGNRYASELRIVMVDEREYPRPEAERGAD